LLLEEPVFSGRLHWNEDPSSVPSPLEHRDAYLTSTQASYKLRDNFFRPEDQDID